MYDEFAAAWMAVLMADVSSVCPSPKASWSRAEMKSEEE
jgi:hypothetical protein